MSQQVCALCLHVIWYTNNTRVDWLFWKYYRITICMRVKTKFVKTIVEKNCLIEWHFCFFFYNNTNGGKKKNRTLLFSGVANGSRKRNGTAAGSRSSGGGERKRWYYDATYELTSLLILAVMRVRPRRGVADGVRVCFGRSAVARRRN